MAESLSKNPPTAAGGALIQGGGRLQMSNDELRTQTTLIMIHIQPIHQLDRSNRLMPLKPVNIEQHCLDWLSRPPSFKSQLEVLFANKAMR